MEFHSMTGQMKYMFVSWYNEQTEKKIVWYMVGGMVTTLVVGYAAMFYLVRASGWYLHDVPLWLKVLSMVWFPFSFFYGAKVGIRTFHRWYRERLLKSLETDLLSDSSFDETQKNVFRDYLIHYLETEPRSIMKEFS